MHCFVCGKPATTCRSLTQLTAPPAGEHDAVPICGNCDEDWTTSLHSILRIDIQSTPKDPP